MDDSLYKLMHDMGDKNIRAKIQRLIDAGHICSTGPGAAVVGNAVGVVLDGVKEFLARRSNTPNSVRTKELIQQIGAERAVAITLQTMFNAISVRGNNPDVNRIRIKVGKALKMEMEFLHLSREEPLSYGYVASELEGASEKDKQRIKRRVLRKTQATIPEWDRSDTLLIAGALVDFTIKRSGIFELERRRRSTYGRTKDKLENLVVIKAEVFEWLIKGVNGLAATSPAHLPITTPPLDWIDDFRGGYPQEHMGSFNLFLSKSARQTQAFREDPCEDLLKAVNTLQRTPWRINRRVFNTFQLAVERDWTEPSVVCRPPPKPELPTTTYIEGLKQPEWVKYGRMKRQWNVLTESYQSGRLLLAKAVSVGSLYLDVERFYFPHRIDFRGRCYPVASPIQYQGPDYQRGCLEFADGKPVTTEEQLSFFLIHGANAFGSEKGTMARRIKWATDNALKWVAVAEDPVENRLWVEADEPFQFLAWCFEYATYHEEGLGFISRLPVCADGSNNGLQIYSLLLRDPIGGLATNCMPSPEPQDIYRDVADKVTEKLLEHKAGDDPKLMRYATRLLSFCKMRTGTAAVPRDAVKRPVMTLPYGSTIFSCQHYISDWYHDYVRGKNLTLEQLPFPEKDAYNIFRWLGTVVWDAIGEVVVKAREAMNWLREVSDVLTEAGVHAEWSTPIGLKVRQDYQRGTTKILRLRAGGQMRLRVWEADGSIQGRSSRNGLCPNYIHSLDASAMFTTVNDAALEGVSCFQMIHDSYGTHAADAPTLNRVLRESFATIFSEDLLQNLYEELQTTLPEATVLPPPPTRGTLDIDRLPEATYFFA